MSRKDVEQFNLAVTVTGEALRQSGHRDPVDENVRRLATSSLIAFMGADRFLREAPGSQRDGLRRDMEQILAMGASALGFDVVKKEK